MLQELGIEGVYVIHAKNGYEYHGERVTQLFAKHNIQFEFVSDADVSEFGNINFRDYITLSLEQRTSKGSLSCALNHVFSLKKVVANKNKYAIIFEDDPCFLGDFEKRITRLMNEVKKLPSGFFISLENTTLKFPSFKDIQKGKLLYPASVSRCAGAYLVDLKAAQDAIKDLETEKMNEVADWWQNRLIEKNVIKMYWAHPPLFEQASHNGILSSTISTKNKNVKQKIKWFFLKLYYTTVRRLFAQKRIIQNV